MATSDDLLRVLQSIDAKLGRLVTERAPGPVKAVPAPAASPAVVASDDDLDGPYGDPEVRIGKAPRGWTGEPMKGRKFSECPALFLDALANMYDWFAQQEPDPKKVHYNRKYAARARGWAARIRAGYKPMTAADIPWGGGGEAF